MGKQSLNKTVVTIHRLPLSKQCHPRRHQKGKTRPLALELGKSTLSKEIRRKNVVPNAAFLSNETDEEKI